MANAQKVANIFELASVAFKKLSELTLDLKIYQALADQGPSTSSRWTIIEVEQLKDAVTRFGNDLTKIASVIETKTLNQIKFKLKNHALEGPGPDHVQEEENDDIKDVVESPEGDLEHVQELSGVSAVSSDRSRRKQTFSERNDTYRPDSKKRCLESKTETPVLTVTKPMGPLITRQVVPGGGIQRLATTGQPTAGNPRLVPSSLSASNVLSHAQMRKQAMMPQESKYAEYSDISSYVVDEGDDHFDDDDDDDEESDAPYYSEDEASVNTILQD